MVEQYDELSAEYAALAEIDPVKQFVQYPGALKLLGNVAGKEILDVGCGNGIVSRILARRGARVVGYDPSLKQIEGARKWEDKNKLGIEYFSGEIPSAFPACRFDDAVSVMVLMYASSRAKLLQIFEFVMRSLKAGGSFCSVTYNPRYRRTGKAAFNRCFTKTVDGRIRVDFLDAQGNFAFCATFSDFSTSDYGIAAKKAGFSGTEWVRLEVIPEGIMTKGERYWDKFGEDPPYVGLRVTKPHPPSRA